jgi:hypothetical protein
LRYDTLDIRRFDRTLHYRYKHPIHDGVPTRSAVVTAVDQTVEEQTSADR